MHDLIKNRHNNTTTTYYLLLQKKIKSGQSSIADVSYRSDLFLRFISSEDSILAHYDHDLNKVVKVKTDFYMEKYSEIIEARKKATIVSDREALGNNNSFWNDTEINKGEIFDTVNTMNTINVDKYEEPKPPQKKHRGNYKDIYKRGGKQFIQYNRVGNNIANYAIIGFGDDKSKIQRLINKLKDRPSDNFNIHSISSGEESFSKKELNINTINTMTTINNDANLTMPNMKKTIPSANISINLNDSMQKVDNEICKINNKPNKINARGIFDRIFNLKLDKNVKLSNINKPIPMPIPMPMSINRNKARSVTPVKGDNNAISISMKIQPTQVSSKTTHVKKVIANPILLTNNSNLNTQEDIYIQIPKRKFLNTSMISANEDKTPENSKQVSFDEKVQVKTPSVVIQESPSFRNQIVTYTSNIISTSAKHSHNTSKIDKGKEMNTISVQGPNTIPLIIGPNYNKKKLKVEIQPKGTKHSHSPLMKSLKVNSITHSRNKDKPLRNMMLKTKLTNLTNESDLMNANLSGSNTLKTEKTSSINNASLKGNKINIMPHHSTSPKPNNSKFSNICCKKKMEAIIAILQNICGKNSVNIHKNKVRKLCTSKILSFL